MEYKKIKVPFLNNKEIKSKVDLFRAKYWDKIIPINMEGIIELKLKIDIFPIPNLQNSFGMDAFITSNWNLIYVDELRFKDERFQNRLRFSLAHEIGHFILHKDIYNAFKIKNIDDFYKWHNQIPQEQYSYLETQANKFANYLLVPRDNLAIERDKALKIIKNKSIPIEKMDKGMINSYISIFISKKFGVSEEVIQISLSYLDNNNEFSE